MEYNSKWTGYGHVATLKSAGGPSDYIVTVKGSDEHKCAVLVEEAGHARAFFFGRIEMIREGHASKDTPTV